jgi:hypothetical protein
LRGLFTYIKAVQFEEIENVPEGEFSELELQCTELHAEVAEYLVSKIGSPDFGGKFGDQAYPGDPTSQSLVAYWKGLRAYLTSEANPWLR